MICTKTGFICVFQFRHPKDGAGNKAILCLVSCRADSAFTSSSWTSRFQNARGGRGRTTAPHRAVGAHLSTHSPFFFLLTLLSASSSKCARLLPLPPFLPPLVPFPPHAAAGRTRGTPTFSSSLCLFYFQKESDNAATSIAHRNTHQTTREFREQLGSCEMAGTKARARSPERRRNGGGRCHKKRRRSLS